MLRCFSAGLITATLVFAVSALANPEIGGLPGYAGSDSCKECHNKIYRQWKLSPHANMLVDAKKDSDAILARDFSAKGVDFKKEDIVYTVGTHWRQKYLTQIDGKLYVLPKGWNIEKMTWEPFFYYNWKYKSYNEACAGCHNVGFDVKTETFFEPGIGCESCHGPGRDHVESGGDKSKIVNPQNLDEDRALMVCMQCHTDGTDTTYDKYPFPVNFKPGEDIDKYFSLFFMPKPRAKRWYWSTMNFMERRRMYYFFASRYYLAFSPPPEGMQCLTGWDGSFFMSKSENCGTCHRKLYSEYKGHSGHTPDKAECTDCHVPEIVEKTQTYSIHDHKFDFSRPKMECSECHDKTDSTDKAVAAISADGVTEWKAEPEKHNFNIKPINPPREMTVKEACLYCHKEKDAGWVDGLVPSTIGKMPAK